ncbi:MULTISPECIES: VOC family protein [unclassified Oceanobacillus]|uniref:VOC family protein n=1 Tax=unclassified Oceanobacillus TaxID=2630292 RepID=UPI001BECC82D|nr:MULTISPECIES: VOC family protein [unclassified Oceanobacillus]MBT2601101.1 VOC family protein [Oceanobacillus sp. ISL-74]MBT2652327.1 VOC family protein [Oceanobacillus sp. ISL-73]
MHTYHSKPNTFVNHVHLKVEDLTRSLEFYQDLMGFQILNQSGNKVEFTANGITPLLTIEQPEGIVDKQTGTTGLYHYALLLPTLKDLGKLIMLLLNGQYPLQGASFHGTHDALYFADPDGNGIEVAVDTDPSTWRDKTGQLDFSKNGPMDIESIIAAANGEKWNGIPEDTILGHIHLHVSDLEKTKEFYHDGLGLDIVIVIQNQGVFFSSGGYHHHIAANVWNGKNAPKPNPKSVGMLLYTLVIPDEETRNAIIEKLETLGYPVTAENGGNFTEDPSGNRVQLYC